MKKGFTLMELLTVILIIGILSAIAVPQYKRSVLRAEMAEGITHGKTIYDAALRFKAANSDLPTTFDQLDVGFINASVPQSEFTDESFTYSLHGDTQEDIPYIGVHNSKGDYEIRFMYPTINENGVFAPIFCCPGVKKSGQWLCTNTGESIGEDSLPFKPSDCAEGTTELSKTPSVQ